ncbi:hemicentin-2-like isoform X2 [Mercenaria mercenaria]|uniref:hemicentin-2-like isoform X2 n=1 Tax=Mercenaria mercenaria TaxID=6596 RepID=UPI00234EA740|nr:hemicentin-2-like isoform X2 [Mercenaria mercenaria]
MLFLVLFLLGSLNAVTGWLCPIGKVIPGIYVNSGQPAIIGFQTTLQTFNGGLQYSVRAFNNSNLYTAVFYQNKFQNGISYLESQFTGDASRGNFTVKTNGIHRQDGGVYILQYKQGTDLHTEMCSMLFVLGKPRKATVSHDNNNVLGRNSQLTCNSSSTTYPTNHTLSLTYNWKVNDIMNPSYTRYKYGASRKTLTITSVTKEDANKSFKCGATEFGDGVTGFTSDYSDEILFKVIYGPDPSTIKLIPSITTYTRNEGDSQNDIQCSGNCYPSCNYKWTKSGSNTAVNRATLSLGSLDRTKTGAYTCTVSNPTTGSKQTKPVSIFVRYGPDASTTTLTPANTTYTLVENTRLDDIVCAADCYPECNYKWTKPDNTVVSNNGVLSLGALNRNEATTYTCTVTRSQTTVSVTKQVYVFVIYGPDTDSVELSPVKRTYRENEGTRLHDITCSTACYPNCTYKWKKSGTNAVVSNTGVLTLGTLDKYKAATYTCTATNPRKSGSAATDVIVHVRYGPDTCTISSVSPLTLTEGRSSPTVSCESECYPSCSHTWSNVSSNSAIGENGQFQLVKTTRYQAGNYQCFCKNTATVQYVKNQTAILHIIIQYPPDVTVSLSTEDITAGNTLSISCDADGVPSVYSYNGLTQTWNGTPVPNAHTEVIGTPKYSTLHIPSLQLQDSGTYTCYVNNGVRTADTVSSVTVKVKVLPKILTHVLIFAGRVSGLINVSLQFYSFPDIEEVAFKRYDDQTITNDTAKKYIVSHYETTVRDKFYGKEVSLSGMQGNLVISNLKKEDFGNYTLILKNELGNTITPFIIDAISPPSGAFDITINNIQQNTVRVSWKPGFHGGFAQTFLIQLSTDRTQWRNEETIYGGTDESEEPMYEVLHNLQESTTYYVRMYAFNSEGNSPFSEVHNFTTLPITVQDNSAAVTAGAVGGAISAVVVIAVIVVVVVLVRREIITKDTIRTRIQIAIRKKQKDQAEVETDGQDNSIRMYEHLNHTTGSENTNVYDALKVDLKATGNSNSQYENLPKAVSTSPTYVNISTGKLNKNANQTYENLKLHSEIKDGK